MAFTFVTPEEGNELTRIEMRINRLLKRDEMPGFVALAKPQPTEDFDAESGEPLEPPRAEAGLRPPHPPHPPGIVSRHGPETGVEFGRLPGITALTTSVSNSTARCGGLLRLLVLPRIFVVRR